MFNTFSQSNFTQPQKATTSAPPTGLHTTPIEMRLILLVVLANRGAGTACSNKEYGQCGGKGWAGETCCQDFDKCNFVNAFYSQWYAASRIV